MGADDRLLEKLASSVADGDPVDWDEADSSASTDEARAYIRNLRVLAGIGASHREIALAAAQGAEAAAGLHLSSMPTSDAPPAEMDRTGSAPPERAAPIAETVPGSWGPLRIVERIGKGAYGDVFRAWEPRIEREVALKLLRPDESLGESEAWSVVEEARLLARVRHANVATVHGADMHDGRVGLWMEFIRGRTLSDLLKQQGSLGAREAAGIGIDVCRALAAVHHAGLIHSDIKAQNVMREEGGRIVLMDFSAGRERREEEPSGDQRISGTPLYMAPESLLRKEISVLSDIYGLGVLLYHLVTGTFPVQAKSLGALREAHERRESALLRDVRPDLPEEYIQVVERALAWDPAERFASAGHMEQALRKAIGAAGEPVTDQAQPFPAPRPETPARRLIASLERIGLRPRFALASAAVAVLATAALLFMPTSIPEIEGLMDPIKRAAIRKPVAPPQPIPLPAGSMATEIGQTPGAYEVEAGLYRRRGDGIEPLLPGSRVSLGDEMFLELKSSRSVYAYVLNEDEVGSAFVLFPIPGTDLQNPLPAGRRHRLPGKVPGSDGTEEGQYYWQATIAGGRDHIIIITSPEPIQEIEKNLAQAPRPSAHRETAYTELSEGAIGRLRGFGGVVEGPAAPPTGSRRIFELFGRLAGRPEQASGVWVRQIDLENPLPR